MILQKSFPPTIDASRRCLNTSFSNPESRHSSLLFDPLSKIITFFFCVLNYSFPLFTSFCKNATGPTHFLFFHPGMKPQSPPPFSMVSRICAFSTLPWFESGGLSLKKNSLHSFPPSFTRLADNDFCSDPFFLLNCTPIYLF